MTINELKKIALHAVKGTVPAEFSNQEIDVNAAFVDGLRELAGSVNQFMKNRYDIYEILIETVDEILPKKVIDGIGMFAEIQQVGQGQKAMFKKPVGRARARQFLTQVGLSGVYETFRLDATTFEVGAHAVGGGATVDFCRMLDGAESLAEVMSVITEGLTDAVFVEVHKALRAAINAQDRPAANKVIVNAFDGDAMAKLCAVVRAYGQGAVIFATPEFVADMGADAIVPVTAPGLFAGAVSRDDIDAIHNTGYVNIFRGTPIVQIPQSFVDENNDKTWIDPQYAYVLPTGNNKVVKVVLEGQTQVKDHENKDNSMEVFAWKKMGCAILTNYNWGIYQNTHVANTYYNPYENL